MVSELKRGDLLLAWMHSNPYRGPYLWPFLFAAPGPITDSLWACADVSQVERGPWILLSTANIELTPDFVPQFE